MAQLDYCELTIGSVATQTAFYGEAFGWQFTSYGPDYAVHEKGACQIGLNGTGEHSDAPILPVIRVDDLEAARNSVTQAGGVIVRDIFAYPGGERFHFRDPEGLVLAVYKPDES